MCATRPVYNGSGLQYYRHADWLGTSRLATTSSRTLYYSGAYAPFGENYAPLGTQDLSFTGQNQDTESSGAGGVGGLYDFLYREHSPVQGRWLSPDPSGLAAVNPADPQTWNRYAYVGNRPLSATDPLGLVLLECNPDWDPDCMGPGEPGDPCVSDPILCSPLPPPIIPPPIGVWPGNETLGLPQGLNTPPLGLDDLLTLSPGINCGIFTSGFVATQSQTAGIPCTVSSVDQPMPILGSIFPKFGPATVTARCTNMTNKPTDGECLFSCVDSAIPPEFEGRLLMSVSMLETKCGPIVACPRTISVSQKINCVAGFCYGRGNATLNWCIQ